MFWYEPMAKLMGTTPAEAAAYWLRFPEFPKQMDQMVLNGSKWLLAHPEEKGKIQVRWPRVSVIGTVEDAIKNKILQLNEPGLALVKSLWPWEGHDAPTLNMVLICLEVLLTKPEKQK